jgi:hypothetical protein
VRHATKPDPRRRAAFVVLTLVVAGLLFWASWRPGEAPQAAGAGQGASAAPSVTAEATRAAAPSARFVGGPIVPTRLRIPAIGVDTTVEHRGTVHTVNAFTGQPVEGYGVPTSMRTTAWWSDGPQPGSGQMAVILGHTQVRGYGVFNRLGTLQPGDPVYLEDGAGDTLRLQVLGAPPAGLDKSTAALADALNGHPADAAVAFVTCGGRFDRTIGQSEDNVVVFASLAP